MELTHKKYGIAEETIIVPEALYEELCLVAESRSLTLMEVLAEAAGAGPFTPIKNLWTDDGLDEDKHDDRVRAIAAIFEARQLVRKARCILAPEMVEVKHWA